MNFVSIRMITDDPKRLVGFYETVTGLAPTWFTDDFAQFKTSSCTLAISSPRTVAMLGADVLRPAENRTVIIEFRVADVDLEYERLEQTIGDFVLRPTTMPWGNRSMLFRDPDGNLINIFAPATADAKKRLDG